MGAIVGEVQSLAIRDARSKRTVLRTGLDISSAVPPNTIAATFTHCQKMADNEMKARRTNVPWVTDTYNDEKLLLAIRSANPHQQWKKIQAAFNKQVPLERERSLWAIGKRARAVLKAKHQAEGIGESGSNVVAIESNVLLLPFPRKNSRPNDKSLRPRRR